jgi:hypothetical protein
MGDALAALGRKAALVAGDVEALEATRDKTPAKPLEF